MLKKGIKALEFSRLLVKPLRDHAVRAVAVSGGVDSMALAILLKEVSTSSDWSLLTFTVDHGIRNNSREEARQVQQTLRAANIHNEILTLEPLPKTGVEKNARIARYTALNAACLKYNATVLYVAHHADDQVETMLMRLLTGSRWRGMIGMRPVAKNPLSQSMFGAHKIELHRPFLTVPKERLVETCRSKNLPWFDDPSNRKPGYTLRNTIRHVLGKSEALPRALQRHALLDLSQELSSKETRLYDNLQQFFQEIQPTICKITCSITFNIELFDRLPVSIEMRAEVFHHLCQLISPSVEVKNSIILRTLNNRSQFTKNIAQEYQASVAGLIFKVEGTNGHLYRQPFVRTELHQYPLSVTPSGSGLHAGWLLYDRRFWLRVRGPQECIVVRALERSDIKSLRSLALGPTQASQLKRFMSLACGLIRFTLPIVWSNTQQRIIALPSADLIFDPNFSVDCHMVCESGPHRAGLMPITIN